MKTATQKNKNKSASKTVISPSEIPFSKNFKLDSTAIDYIDGKFKEAVTADELVVRIKRSQHYDVIKAFLRYQFGMVASENFKNKLPSFYADNGREFNLDHLEEVYYTYPLSESGRNCLWIVNNGNTLFIYDDGEMEFMFDNMLLMIPQARAWQRKNRKKV